MALGQMGFDPRYALFGHDGNGLLFVGEESLAVDAGAVDVRSRGHHLWLPDQKLEAL